MHAIGCEPAERKSNQELVQDLVELFFWKVFFSLNWKRSKLGYVGWYKRTGMNLSFMVSITGENGLAYVICNVGWVRFSCQCSFRGKCNYFGKRENGQPWIVWRKPALVYNDQISDALEKELVWKIFWEMRQQVGYELIQIIFRLQRT